MGLVFFLVVVLGRRVAGLWSEVERLMFVEAVG